MYSEGHKENMQKFTSCQETFWRDRRLERTLVERDVKLLSLDPRVHQEELPVDDHLAGQEGGKAHQGLIARSHPRYDFQAAFLRVEWISETRREKERKREEFFDFNVHAHRKGSSQIDR